MKKGDQIKILNKKILIILIKNINYFTKIV